MKRFGATKFLGIIGTLILLFLNACWVIPVNSAENETGESKVSSLLSLHIRIKTSQPANNLQGTTKPAGVDPQTRGETTVVDKEQIFIHFSQQPTTAQLNELNSLGVTVYLDSWMPPVNNFKTGFVLAEMPVDKLDSLAAKNYIVSLDTAEQQLSPQNDLARSAMNIDPVWNSGYTGAGVTVAVLDSGLDTSNPDFPTPVAAVDYSNYPNKDSIIANQVTGHGTHVTGSLLGRGVHGAAYKGVAPGASLVFIKIGNDTNGLATSAAVTYAIRDALDIYDVKIINISYGGWSQYHDGTDQMCQAVDYATSQGAAVFAAGGNEGSYGWHYSGTVNAYGTTSEIPVAVASGYTSYLYANLVWSDGIGTYNNLSLQYYNSSHALLPPQVNSGPESFRGTQSTLYQMSNLQSPGTYYLRVQNNSPNNQFFHVYYGGGSSGVTFSNPSPNYTIDSPAEADSAIAVGAYVTRYNWTNYQGKSYHFVPQETTGSIATFSSRGPRVDTGAPPKPDIVAPGSAIISVRDPIYAFGGSLSGIANDPVLSMMMELI